MRSYSRILGGSLIFMGSGLFLLGMIIAEARYPGYSISANKISDLGVGPTAIIFNSAAILDGLAVAASLLLIRRHISSRIFLILLGLSGIGILGVGLFPETTAYHIHDVFAAIAFIFGGFSAVYSSRLLLTPFRYLSAYLGGLSTAALLLYIIGYHLGLGPGGMERLVVYPIIIWSMGFGGALMEPYRS
jgi:hypothetical membrane protein